MKTKNLKDIQFRPGLQGCSLFVLSLFMTSPGWGMPLDTGNPDLTIRFDNTVKYSNAYRVMEPSSKLTSDINLNDGDKNFKSGFVSNRVDILNDLDIAYKNVGARFSAAGWYDSMYNQGNSFSSTSGSGVSHNSVGTNSFTDQTAVQMGKNYELLDVFVYGKIDIDGMQAAGRAGRHSIQWGETLFMGANGIAGGQAPVDLVKLLMVPSSQFKEILRPVNQISGTLQINSQLSVAAYYQLEWRPTLLPPAGSFLSSADFVGNGSEMLYLPGVAAGTYLQHTTDINPTNAGQGGLEVRYSPAGSDVDLGFYAIRYSAKTPEIYVRPGVSGAVGSQFGNYSLVYQEGIQAYGASASTSIGDVNVATEFSGRVNQDLVSDPVNITNGTGGVHDLSAGNRGNVAYAVGDTLHGNVSAVYLYGPSTGLWDGGSLLAEVGWNHVIMATENKAAIDPNTTRDAVATRFIFEPSYFQVLPGLDLSIPVGFGYNPYGNSRAILNFNGGAERGGDWSVGIKGTYLDAWKIGLTYTSFWGSTGSFLTPVNGVPTATLSHNQTLADRDFVAFSVQRSF